MGPNGTSTSGSAVQLLPPAPLLWQPVAAPLLHLRQSAPLLQLLAGPLVLLAPLHLLHLLARAPLTLNFLSTCTCLLLQLPQLPTQPR